ncbi:GNAT family N-acetyltransferase [Georgenia thermotolerans]|uniref:GNAT family N-acetyltransferase n=1 Tax=Georgenia thermotolerans TaxID=527326 RepID=A0A7J5ULX1_9MICO|nr:GNAT family N-acetyltransferase [Georgenia thermotolerans]KAE8763356.1 GNAT family N-acetyltransferase [Georgenia thermotolerans]
MPNVRIRLLEDVPPSEAGRLASQLAALDVLPEQRDFSGSPASVVKRGVDDPTRRTFVILVERTDGPPEPVGVGALHPDAAGRSVYPGPHVLLRGLSIDARHQGRGIGTAAVTLAVELAARVAPDARAVVLRVHRRNAAARRAYARAGFAATGQSIDGPTGVEEVMVRRLDGRGTAGQGAGVLGRSGAGSQAAR